MIRSLDDLRRLGSGAVLAFACAGNLGVPLSILHTTGDPIVPLGQFQAYAAKVTEAGRSGLLDARSMERHGHCNFEALEILGAFSALMQRITSQPASLLAVASP